MIEYIAYCLAFAFPFVVWMLFDALNDVSDLKESSTELRHENAKLKCEIDDLTERFAPEELDYGIDD